MALTFERKPDKGGETNHIGCIGIAAEGAEPTVLLLRTGTDEARCKASGFLTKSVATYSGTKYVSGSEKKGDEKKFEASFGIELSSLTDIKGLDTLAEEKGIGARGTAKLALQMGFYLDRPGLSVFGDFKPDSALSEIQEKYAKENAWFTLETGKKLEASEKKEPKAKGKKEKAKEEPKAEEKKEKGKKKGKKEKAEAKPEPEPPAEKEGKKKKKGKGKGKEEEPEPVAEVPKKKGKGKGKEKEEPKPVAKEEKPKKGKGKGKGEKEETPAPTTSPKGKGKKGKAAEEPAPAPAKNGKGKGKAEEPKETGKKAEEPKEKFTSISKLEPDSSNVNLKVTVVSVKSKGKGKKGKGKGKGGKEAVVGDSTGLVTLSLTTEQAGQLKAGNCISIRGGNVDMVTIGSGGFVRLKVDGDLDVAESGGPEPNSSNDISATEYELVQA